MSLVLVCFTFRLNWFGTTNKLRTHGPRSPIPTHPVAPHGSIVSCLVPSLLTLLKSLLIATLKAWYKYRAITKQQPSAKAKPLPPPLRLPWLPLQQQQRGSPSCHPSIGPWGVEHGSFAPCEIAHGQLKSDGP